MATQLLTVPQAAARLAVHRQSAYELIWAGKLKAVDVGTGGRPRLRVRESEIEAFADRNELKAVSR